MNELKNRLISKAQEIFIKIYPCGGKRDLTDCFTVIGNKLVFWFNTEDQSTHLLSLLFDRNEE
jgi:hypothetical protein